LYYIPGYVPGVNDEDEIKLEWDDHPVGERDEYENCGTKNYVYLA